MEPIEISELSLMEKLWPNLYLHSANVANLVLKICSYSHINEIDIKTIILGALLHDVGKIFLGREIVDKPSPLTNNEWEKMQKHPCLGALLIAEKGGSKPLIEMIRYHHERWDGKGYEGLQGEEIPLYSRIIAIADALDAMTSSRPYRLSLNLDEAFQEIHQCSGSQFDPQLVASLALQPSWQTVTYLEPDRLKRQIIEEKRWLNQLVDSPAMQYYPLRYAQNKWLERIQATFWQIEYIKKGDIGR